MKEVVSIDVFSAFVVMKEDKMLIVHMINHSSSFLWIVEYAYMISLIIRERKGKLEEHILWFE